MKRTYVHTSLPYTLEVTPDNITLSYKSALPSGTVTDHKFTSIEEAMDRFSLEMTDFKSFDKIHRN